MQKLFSLHRQERRVIKPADKRLGLVFVSKFGPPSYSGAGRLVFRLAKMMSAMGVGDIFFISGKTGTDVAESEKLSGVNVHRVPLVTNSTVLSDAYFHLRCALWMIKHRKRFDLIQVVNVPRLLAPIIVVARFLKKPIFLRTSLYGSDDLASISNGRFGWLRLNWVKLTQGVITISKSIDEISRTAYTRPGFLWHVPNFVDPSVFHPAKNKDERRLLREKLGLPPESPIILFCGSVRYRKGVDLLVEAWKAIVALHPDARLCLVGPRKFGRVGETNEDFSRWLDRRIKESGLGSTILFFGEQTESIPEFFRVADIFALPSRQEGMPNAVLEAMASEVPVVICKQPWVPEGFVRDGDWGRVVEPDSQGLSDAIIDLLDSPERVRQMGKNAREVVLKNYAPEQAVLRYLSVYSSHIHGISKLQRAVVRVQGPILDVHPERPILVVTRSFPPSTSGSSLILHNLLRHFPAESLVAVHGLNPSLSPSPDLCLLVDRYSGPNNGSGRMTAALGRRFPEVVARVIARRVERVGRLRRAARIYAHYPNDIFVVAAWMAARRLGLPLTIYFDILWEESVLAISSKFARTYEPKAVQYADRRIAVTEYAADFLRRKHGVDFEVIPHTADLSEIVERGIGPGIKKEPNVLFAGGIYPRMNLDSIERLARAADCSRTQPFIDLCTIDLPKSVRGERLRVSYLGRRDLLLSQRASHILYLPQAFHSECPEMVRTNFPTKAIDYFLSGVPVLVHSPRDSYLSVLAREEGIAFVVDEPNDQALADGIDRLMTDDELRERVIGRAFEFIKKRDSYHWAQRLWDNLKT